jgi:hypothetical protein
MSISSRHVREFGFLVEQISGKFSGGSITPLEDHSDRTQWLEESSNRDGYYYPPEEVLYVLDPGTMERKHKLPRSGRPALLYPLPASHRLCLTSPLDATNAVSSDDALIIHLLAYVYGRRLQFADWKFDGRVPVRSLGGIHIRPETTLDFLGHSYEWWRSNTLDIRKRLIHILYVFTRGRSLEWEWDEFIHQYMVFDGLYRLHCKLDSAPPKRTVPHKHRIGFMLEAYGIPSPPNSDLVQRLCDVRNDLFHEAAWDGETICFGNVGTDAFSLPRHLARLNSRLICGILNYRNDYSVSAWWAMGSFSFGRAT